MISMTIKLPRLDDVVPKPALVQRAITAAAAKYLQLQAERIRQGRTVSGSPMTPYSPQYREDKTAAGRMGQNYWLRLTGKMLRSQRVKMTRARGYVQAEVIFVGTRAGSKFTNSTKRAAWNRASRNQRGGFERTWRESRKDKGRGRVTVTNTDRSVSNALIAAVNDRSRPFVGVNKREIKRLTRTYVKALTTGG